MQVVEVVVIRNYYRYYCCCCCCCCLCCFYVGGQQCESTSRTPKTNSSSIDPQHSPRVAEAPSPWHPKSHRHPWSSKGQLNPRSSTLLGGGGRVLVFERKTFISIVNKHPSPSSWRVARGRGQKEVRRRA